MKRRYNVVIVGAGPAGIGCAIALKHLGVTDVVVVDRYDVGGSFRRWTRGMRLITPSFNSNNFGWLDYNAVAPFTSVAFTLGVEHPTGPEYADYLEALAGYFELGVEAAVDVVGVERAINGFRVRTTRGSIASRFVIWAAGEYQYPRATTLDGAGLGRHSGTISDWARLRGDRFVIIGGYESGMDAAVQLVAAGKSVTVFDRSSVWKQVHSDPSLILSPYTSERVRLAQRTGRLRLRGEAEVAGLTRDSDGYRLLASNGRTLAVSDTRPILATGFETSARRLEGLFAWRPDGLPELTVHDESTLTPGLFLAGPSVRQGGIIFCFIYKFRQRFAVIASQIGERFGLDLDPLAEYRKRGLFLDDLSCCGEACAC